MGIFLWQKGNIWCRMGLRLMGGGLQAKPGRTVELRAVPRFGRGPAPQAGRLWHLARGEWVQCHRI